MQPRLFVIRAGRMLPQLPRRYACLWIGQPSGEVKSAA
jgi:hypothetical protein